MISFEQVSQNGQPALLQMPGTNDFYLPCFSTEEKLRDIMKCIGGNYKTKQIKDGAEFLSSIPMTYNGQNLHIIIDPWFTPEGKVRFTQIFRNLD